MMEDSLLKVCLYYNDKNVEICSTDITVENNRIIVRGEGFQLLPHQSVVDIVGYFEDGIEFMKANITLSTASQVNLDIIASGKEKQDRREFLKVRIFLDVKLIRGFSLGKRQKPYLINENIKTRDLSLGGVAFYSNSFLFKKQKIEMDFSQIKPGYKATGQVLRRTRGLYPGGYRYKYACNFLDVEGHKERVLCEFVFKTQLENHRRKKNAVD
ncbi:MAG: PilZ domain-containing protein [Anaerovoracaceae bacterium]|jgi:hypothetical protein